MIEKDALLGDYVLRHRSMAEVALEYGCSLHKVKYWMDKYKIPTRSISEAVYIKNNPKGDPFNFKIPENNEYSFLLGLGLGLYWGEGTKADKNTVRIGNSDPYLILKFMEFLEKLFSLNRSDFKFSLQIFGDINEDEALDFWVKKLKIEKKQFYKTTLTDKVAKGTYRKRCDYGVLIVYYHNKKLRELFGKLLADVAQLAEHDHGKIGVTGSNPVVGSK